MFTKSQVAILNSMRERADAVCYEITGLTTLGSPFEFSQVLFFHIDGVWIKVCPVQYLDGRKSGLNMMYGVEPWSTEYSYKEVLFNGKWYDSRELKRMREGCQ